MMTTMEPNNNANDVLSVTLTLRMIMQGKEVGSIIGKKGDNIKKFRDESGAKINISDGSCPERIVTVTGTTETIYKAFDMICKKLEEDLQNTPAVPKPPVTLRLVIPATQCGSLIGKAGTKIKEIREGTGASVQVASEMLPNSTERAVTISGSGQAVTQCIFHICHVMLELPLVALYWTDQCDRRPPPQLPPIRGRLDVVSRTLPESAAMTPSYSGLCAFYSPPKGATIPYRPRVVMASPGIVYAGGQAYAIQGQLAMPQPAVTDMSSYLQYSKLGMLGGAPAGSALTAAHSPYIFPAQGAIMPNLMGFPRPAATAPTPALQQTHELTIPNELIGCIIGRSGCKINEIRNLSKAQIKIANSEEGTTDRKVTITGTPETIQFAEYLINTNMELHKNVTNPELPTVSTPTSLTTQPPPPQPPVATATVPMTSLMKPVAMLGLGLNTTASSPATAAGYLDASILHKQLQAQLAAAQAAAAAASKAKVPLMLPNGMRKTPDRAKFAPY